MIQKSLFTALLVFLSISGWAQEKLTVSTGKMGPFRIEMKKQQVEKILNKKLVFTTTDDGYYKKADVIYNDYTFTMTFDNQTDINNIDSFRIQSITTKDVRIKTPSGIGIGNSKLDLFNAYSDKYDITLNTPWEQNPQSKKYEKAIGKRTFSIIDSYLFTQLEFTLFNNFVSEITLTAMTED